MIGIAALGTALFAAPRSNSSSASIQKRAEPAACWRRMVVIGASASAGFTESEPLGGPHLAWFQLNRYLDAAVKPVHPPALNFASRLFFLSPEAQARIQIAEAARAEPTLAVGLDFLFWFVYGPSASDAARIERLEAGLKLLDALRCPLVVGDLPDASGADPEMLAAEDIPAPQTLAQANARLRRWASSRANVSVVALSRFMRSAKRNQAIAVHGRTLPKGQTSILLQADALHPSPPGCATLALMALDAFERTRANRGADQIDWDPKRVFQRVFHSEDVRR